MPARLTTKPAMKVKRRLALDVPKRVFIGCLYHTKNASTTEYKNCQIPYKSCVTFAPENDVNATLACRRFGGLWLPQSVELLVAVHGVGNEIVSSLDCRRR